MECESLQIFLIMTPLPPTRKRNRSYEEEDFLPLSKKINNLHINNWKNIDSPQGQLIKWNNSSEEFVMLCSQTAANGRQENNSRNSSPLESAQENLPNGFNENELIENYKHVNGNLHKNSSYSQGKWTNGESSSQENRVQNNWPTIYDPDLSADENPYYYESNKLLFGLYIERLQRGCY